MSALRYYDADGRPQWREQRDPYWSLTSRQRTILDTVRGHNGNRSRAARQLAISFAAVQASLRIATAAGVSVPSAGFAGAARGPDLRDRRGKPTPCGTPMPVAGQPCARGRGHLGGHRTAAAERREREAQSRFEHGGVR